MYDLAGENELDLEALRARLRRMSDRELFALNSQTCGCFTSQPRIVSDRCLNLSAQLP